MIVTFNFFKL